MRWFVYFKQMIIKNVEPVDHLYLAKVRLYDFMRAMTLVIVQADYGLIQLFVTAIIISIPFIAIEFKNNDFFPSTPSNIFRMCLLTKMPEQFGISENIISAIVIVTDMLVILGSAFHLLFESFFDPLTKLVTFMIKIVQLIAVPMLDFALQKFMDMFAPESSIGQKVFGGLIMMLTAVALLIAALGFFFEVRLVRKKTTLWNLENTTSFTSFLFFLFQACLISTQAVTMLLAVLMSLSFCVCMLNLPSGMVGEAEHLIHTSWFRYRVVTDITIVVSILMKNPNFAFGLWITGILLMIGYHVLAVYRKKQRKLFLPVCNSPPEDFYDFYYCCKQEFKGDEGNSRQNLTTQHSYIYHLHRFHCNRATCRLNEWLQVSTENELQTVINAIIEAKKDKCLHNKIVHELWNLELGKRCRVSILFDKTMTISEDYALYCIDKMTKDSEVTIQSSQSNKNAIIKVFYDLIFDTSSHYSLFYEELSRAIPIIDSLVRHGTEIHQKIAKLKEVYAQLLKLKLINFKMIELYIEFVSKFVSEEALDKDDISRLSKLQQNIYFEDISENYLPTLTFYPESGSIQNANCEAQKFLRTTRFELKCSGVNDISQPELSLEQLHVLSNREESSAREEPLHLFFCRGDEEFGIGSVVVDERLLKGKKVLVMQITEDLFSSQKNVFLVDEEFALKLSLRQHIKIKAGSYRAKPLILDWVELFNKYVTGNREKIERSKMVKIVTEIRECTLVVKRLTCAVPGHQILETQMMLLNETDVKGRRKQNSVISFRKKSGSSPQKQKFQFHYSENEDSDKSVVLGLKGDANNIIERLRQKTLTSFEKGLTAEVVERVIKEDTEFDRGIKTYRLWEGELYNVDLEDREAYNASFEGKMAEEHRLEIENNSSFECYVSVGVVLLGLALVGISAFVIIQFQNSTSTINTLSKQHTNIDSLMIDFNRIMGLLRDLASGFSAEFPSISISAEIEDSYTRIQALKTQPLFDNVEHSIEFQGLKMTGTLIELVDVMFAHINQILSNGNLIVVESIHTTCVDLVNQMEDSQTLIFVRMSTEFQGLTFKKNIALFCSLAIIPLLFILLVYFCYRSSGKLKNNLSPLLFLSDGDAHTYQENASKIKYAVEMIRKNFQVDTQSLLISGTDGKRRKHPKKVTLSTEILATVVFLAVAALAVHLGCLFFFSYQFQGSLQHFLQMKTSSEALIKSYSAPAELATLIGHDGQIQIDEIDKIKLQFDYIMFHMSSFEFSPALNSFISTLYFSDSCQLLMPLYNMTEEQCYNTTPEFTIKNPFQIGLAYYFNRQNYYFYNNVTEVFAHTSIHSRPFAEIMTNLTTRFSDQSLETVSAIERTVDLMSYIIIAIDVCYILAFFGVQLYFRKQISSIRVIVEFFRQKLVTGRAEPKVEEKESDQSQRQSESDEELMSEARKEHKDRRRKRTTIQSKLPLAVHLD